MSMETIDNQQGIERNYTINFSGTTGHDSFWVDIPDSVAVALKLEEQDDGSYIPPEFSMWEAIRQLPMAATADVGVLNPYSDEFVPINKANAIINPELAQALAQGHNPTLTGDKMTYATSSDRYTVVNPTQAWDPFIEALQDADLGQNVAGQFRVYEYGSVVHGDLYFLNDAVTLPNRDPLFVGVQFGNSFDGSTSVYVSGFAMDGWCKNTMRYVTDKVSRKHVGTFDQYKRMYETVLEQMGAFKDHLLELVAEALEIETDFRELPFEVEDYYELLGLPTYLANMAANDAQRRSVAEGGRPYLLNAFILHSGLTYALTHGFRGRTEHGTLEDYYRLARDILYNPLEIMAQVEVAYERRLTEQLGDTPDAQEEARAQQERAQIASFKQTLFEKREQFLENEERMEALIAAYADLEGVEETE